MLDFLVHAMLHSYLNYNASYRALKAENKILHTLSITFIMESSVVLDMHMKGTGMSEEDKKDFSFIREKIKERPINKRRLFKHGISTVFFAILFGLVACFVFTYMRPTMEAWLHPKSGSTITIPEDRMEEETETTEEKNTESQEVTEPEVPTEKIIKQEMELFDYQVLQNKVYDVGRGANRFIVTVTAVKSDTDWYNNPYESKGQSSGIIIGDNSQELFILTEKRVISEAQEISVTFINDVTVTASLKRYDGNTGLAVLAVNMTQISEPTKEAISYAILGNGLSVSQGNLVIAVGSPLGNNYSIATGNITSVGNTITTIDTIYSVFTTDIVGSSSSSGAILNLEGEIIGLVMQEYGSQGDENTLTAISISELKKLIEMLSNGRDIPYFGLKVCTVTDTIAEDYEIPQGVFIKEVMLDSPALEAGLQSGDVIVEIGGDAVLSIEAYEAKIYSLHPGDVIPVVVKRQNVNEYVTISCQVTAGQLK